MRVEAIKSSDGLGRGWHQGCVLATLGAILPYHLALAEASLTSRTRYVCQSDDTYCLGHPSYLYQDFSNMRDKVERECDLISAPAKIKAIAAKGGTNGIPAWILDAQGGEIHTFKCVGAYIHTDSPAGRSAAQAALRAAMADRLAPLDGIDGVLDTMYERDVLQIRYGFVRRCASRMCNHWLRTMLPSIRPDPSCRRWSSRASAARSPALPGRTPAPTSAAIAGGTSLPSPRPWAGWT